ncbi:GAF domain-containing protein [[Kitasatospora] papulosa]|uniref:GAF domain-containing protein n=1 Tax=[Kitasatospora] papulosa TaxID=1464011 RepID=UPI002E303F56|nr:GAF domain-containing protein [[Kitasatospora] papulosa]
MQWLGRYWTKVLLLIVSSALGAGVFAASVLAGDDHFKDKELWFRVGVILAFVVVLITAADTALNERERERARQQVARAARTLGVTYNNTLQPLSAALGELAQQYSAAFSGSGAPTPPVLATAQIAQWTMVRTTVLTGTAVLTADPDPTSGLPRARCSYYRLHDPAKHEFKLEDWAGAPPGPRAEIKGSAGSHLLHDILECRTPFHVGRASGLVSQIDQFSSKYKSVIAVPVFAGTAEFGVLIVDAPLDTDLTVEHVVLMQSVAGLLGATLALTK